MSHGDNSISFSSNERQGENCRRNVVLTGFGLFRDHLLNPSWEAIKGDRLKLDRSDINLIKRQINVAYQEVDEVVDELWKTFCPILMIHVGLAAMESSIRIEERARHGPYIHDDVERFAPHDNLRVYEAGATLEENVVRHNYVCKPCEFDTSRTCFNVEKLCTKLNRAFEDGKVKIPYRRSTDAGLYLCEYIYKKSLSFCDRVIFIHVPDIVKFKLDDISAALKHCIETLIEEIDSVEQL